MTKELIARLQHDYTTKDLRVMHQLMFEAAAALEAKAAEIARLTAETDRLTTLARGQHIELYNARLQIAAAQGQSEIDLTPRTPEKQAEALRWIESLRTQQAQPEPLTDSYVQPVPDTCDRITWRNRYYHLPLEQAQPEPVNAMLLEALEAAEKLEHEALVALSEATYELKVGNTYTTATDTYKANNDLIHRLDKILNSQYRDRKHATITAAQQAQPERAPLSLQEIADAWGLKPENIPASDIEAVREIEAAHGIGEKK